MLCYLGEETSAYFLEISREWLFIQWGPLLKEIQLPYVERMNVQFCEMNIISSDLSLIRVVWKVYNFIWTFPVQNEGNQWWNDTNEANIGRR